MIADKFYTDECLRNTDYGLVDGISIEELNYLECDLLLLMNYNLLINQESIEGYRKKLMGFLNLYNKNSKKKKVG